MVADLRLRGMMGRRGLMFVSYYGKSRAFISNYRSWREYDSVGKTAEVASSIISHESIHLALERPNTKYRDETILEKYQTAIVNNKYREIIMIKLSCVIFGIYVGLLHPARC